MIEHRNPVTTEQAAQAVAPARDRRLGDAEEQLRYLVGEAGAADRRQRRDDLHQRLAGAAGFRHRDEARRSERQTRQHPRIGVGIEIVHEVQARAVAQCAEPRHPAAGELRHRLAAEARPAGAEKDDVSGTGHQPLRRALDGCDIIGLFWEPQQRQLAVRMARPDPCQRTGTARQRIGIGRGRHAAAADTLLTGIVDGLRDRREQDSHGLALKPASRQPPLAGVTGGRPTTVTSMPPSSSRLATRFTSAMVTASTRLLRLSM